MMTGKLLNLNIGDVQSDDSSAYFFLQFFLYTIVTYLALE